MTKKKTNTTADVVEEAAEVSTDIATTTADEIEVETPDHYEVEINGETVTLEDKYPKDKTPGVLVMLQKNPRIYAPILLEQIVGPDQLVNLLEMGATDEDLIQVVTNWAQARGVEKKE